MAVSSIRFCGRWPLARCKGRFSRRAVGLAACLVAGLLAFTPSSASAQIVQGQLLDPSSGLPVEGALILLLNQSGEEVGGYLTNQAGRFIIQAPNPGTYTLRAERIGYETTTSDPFRLDLSQRFGIRLESSQAAIELEEIRVEGDQQCVVRPGEGLQLAAVWDEARKALTVQDWAEREGMFRFQMARYERKLDVFAKVIESETRQVQSGVAGTPIRSLPVEDLLTEGFVRRNDEGGYNYYGPDASVLLSDQFLNTHCFHLVRDRERPGELGLRFEPVSLAGVPDIGGTLWLEAETAHLGVLEYSYTWSPWISARGVGQGRVQFESLPNGAWVIRSWWIRMPMMGEDFSVSPTNNSRIRLVGIMEVGGEITRISSLGQTTVSDLPRGILEGRVWDSTRFSPLAGATVFLSGTQYSAETDDGGTFLMPDLPEGIFSATFSHPRLDSLGIYTSGVEVQITPGEFTTVELGIPSSAGILVSTCTEQELADRAAVVIGYVREAGTETPLEGASVTVTWSTFEERGSGTFVEHRHGLQTTSDSTGRYSACGVPLDTTLTLKAVHQGLEADPVVTRADDSGYTVVHLLIGE